MWPYLLLIFAPTHLLVYLKRDNAKVPSYFLLEVHELMLGCILVLGLIYDAIKNLKVNMWGRRWGHNGQKFFLILKSHMCVITKYFSKLFNGNLVFRKSILPKYANFCSSTIFCTVTKLLRYYQYNHVHLQVNSKLLFTSLNTIAYIRSYFVKK